MLRRASSGALSAPPSHTEAAIRFESSNLCRQFETLRILPPTTLFNISDRPHTKRRKLEPTPKSLVRIFRVLYRILDVDYTDSHGDLTGVIKYDPSLIRKRNYLLTINRTRFFDLEEKSQCTVLDLLGHACCATIDGFAVKSLPGRMGSSTFHCNTCSHAGLPQEQPTCRDPGARTSIISAFKTVVEMPDFNGLRRPRVAAMTTLRRLVTHSPDSDFLNLETSTIGLWCMKSLSSSNRELRVVSWYVAEQNIIPDD